MKKLKKMLAVFLAAALAVVSMAGCGSGSPASSDGGGKTIKLGVSAFPGWFLYYVAEGAGLFEKNGVDVELVWFPVYSDSIQAFNSGNLDMLCIALPDAVAPYTLDQSFKMVAVNDFSNGGDGLVCQSQYNSIEDLKGKSIATEYGTIEHFFLLKALETVGMSESDINLVNMSISDGAPALISKSVDASCLWEPALSTALSSPDNKLLYNSEATPGLIQDTTIATNSLIESNPDGIKAVINAYLDAVDYYMENPDESLGYMAKPAGVDTEQMKQVMAGGHIYGLQDMLTGMTTKAEDYLYAPYTAYENAKFLHSVKLLDNLPSDEWYYESMLDASFVKEIAETREVTAGPDTKAMAAE